MSEPIKKHSRRTGMCPLCESEGRTEAVALVGWQLCDRHYRQQIKTRVVATCAGCGRERRIYAEGLCHACHYKLHREPVAPYVRPSRRAEHRPPPPTVRVTLPDHMVAELEDVLVACELTMANYVTELIEVDLVRRTGALRAGLGPPAIKPHRRTRRCLYCDCEVVSSDGRRLCTDCRRIVRELSGGLDELAYPTGNRPEGAE